MSPKTIFLSEFFLFASALCLQAQETFEYATVTYAYFNGGYYIGVSTEDNYVETKVKPEVESKHLFFNNKTMLVAKVNELSKGGWEVFSTTSGPSDVTYHLRKKKP